MNIRYGTREEKKKKTMASNSALKRSLFFLFEECRHSSIFLPQFSLLQCVCVAVLDLCRTKDSLCMTSSFLNQRPKRPFCIDSDRCRFLGFCSWSFWRRRREKRDSNNTKTLLPFILVGGSLLSLVVSLSVPLCLIPGLPVVVPSPVQPLAKVLSCS